MTLKCIESCLKEFRKNSVTWYSCSLYDILRTVGNKHFVYHPNQRAVKQPTAGSARAGLRYKFYRTDLRSSGNKTEKKTRREIMESCQDLGTLIIVCTIIICVLCLCVLKKTRNVPSYRLRYGDTHDLIRKPARILNERKIDSVQWRISRKQPIEHSEQPF